MPQQKKNTAASSRTIALAGGSMEIPGGFPEDYDALVRMGNDAMDKGNFAIAAEAYRRALTIDGSSLSVRTDFGACLHGMGLAERALQELRKVITADPAHLIATFNMGIVHFTMNQSDSARQYMERVLTLTPDQAMETRAKEVLSDLNG
jgi:Tfp pilus assembly protein PilF